MTDLSGKCSKLANLTLLSPASSPSSLILPTQESTLYNVLWTSSTHPCRSVSGPTFLHAALCPWAELYGCKKVLLPSGFWFWVWPVGGMGRRSEGERRESSQYLFCWLPLCLGDRGTVLTLRVGLADPIQQTVLGSPPPTSPSLRLECILQPPASRWGSTTSSCPWKWPVWLVEGGASLCSLSPHLLTRWRGSKGGLRSYRIAAHLARKSLAPCMMASSWSCLLTHRRLWHKQKMNLYSLKPWDLGFVGYTRLLDIIGYYNQ